MNTDIQQVIDNFRPVFEFALDKLKSNEKRIYLAQIAQTLGYGGQKIVCETFGVNPKTLQKGLHELNSGNPIVDAFEQRGRKPIEHYLPNLLQDIKKMGVVVI